jgi:hypothetical protein
MKINLHIVLFEKENFTNPMFEKVIAMEVTPDNFSNFLSGVLRIGLKPLCHIVNFGPVDFDKNTSTLKAKAQMLHTACNGYVQDLIKDNWKEIPQP